MSSRLSDPQRLVDLVADQMFRDEMRSLNSHRRAGENAAVSTPDRHPAHDSGAAAEQHSPCGPPHRSSQRPLGRSHAASTSEV